MSWLFSQALVVAFSAACSWDGAPCAQLNVMPTAQPFWRNGKPMDACRFSRFGLTFQVLTAGRGEALLRWYRAGFPARTSASPDRVTDSTVSAAGYGEKCGGSFARFDRAASTWRTAQCSLLEDSDECSVTWPRWGSMRNGVCYPQPTWVPGTCATESGLKLSAEAMLWPTVTVHGNYNRKGLSSQSGDGLATMVRRFNGDARNGRLNPTWVEWLMGWPIGWSALQPLAMDRFREWQQQHSATCAHAMNGTDS